MPTPYSSTGRQDRPGWNTARSCTSEPDASSSKRSRVGSWALGIHGQGTRDISSLLMADDSRPESSILFRGIRAWGSLSRPNPGCQRRSCAHLGAPAWHPPKRLSSCNVDDGRSVPPGRTRSDTRIPSPISPLFCPPMLSDVGVAAPLWPSGLALQTSGVPPPLRMVGCHMLPSRAVQISHPSLSQCAGHVPCGCHGPLCLPCSRVAVDAWHLCSSVGRASHE